MKLNKVSFTKNKSHDPRRVPMTLPIVLHCLPPYRQTPFIPTVKKDKLLCSILGENPDVGFVAVGQRQVEGQNEVRHMKDNRAYSSSIMSS
jgi:hypothetical protein